MLTYAEIITTDLKELTDEEFFGTKEIKGFYKKVIDERNRRLMANYISERVAKR